MSVLTDALKRAIEDRCLVEIYRDRLAGEPLRGRLMQFSSFVFVLEKVDQLNRADGLVAARVRDITRLRRGSRELSLEAELVEWPPERLPLPEIALLETSSALTILQKTFGHVAIYIEAIASGVCFIGEAHELDDDFVRVTEFGPLKSLDRPELLLPVEDITRVEAGGVYERQLDTVYRSRLTD
jgi:hypothetical protein